MLVASDHLGDVEVDEERILQVPDGIIGFPHAKRFAVVAAEESGLYSWLQAVDDPELAFLAVVPFEFFPDYEPELPEEDALRLELTDPADAQVLCLVTIADDGVTANLLGPIVVNVRTRTARQVVLAGSNHPTRAPLTGD